ncbi:MFS transporter [Sphingomonas solaris]|nr:MFS transporter [Sphingomonas solaris]
MTDRTAAREWATGWPVPLIAMMGIAGSTLMPTTIGVFLQPVTAELGLSQIAFTASFMVQILVGLVAIPVAGRIADRIGARRLLLIGIVPYTLTLGLFGIANGSIWQWWGLCALNAIGLACICIPVWLKPVVTEFHTSRGLALAVALAGIGLSTAIMPLLATWYVQALGWRWAYLALAASWAVPMLLLVYFVLDRSHREASAVAQGKVPARILRQHLLSPTFYCLALAGGIYACASYGLFIMLIPMLTISGLGASAAASVVGVFGMSSLIGRVVVGLLLDRLPARFLSVVVFLLPVPATLLLMRVDGSMTVAVAAAALLGMAGGAENDILAYMAARRFPVTMFASVYSVATVVFAISASAGPLLSSVLFSTYGTYDVFLVATIPMVMVGALLIGLIPAAGTRVHGAEPRLSG